MQIKFRIVEYKLKVIQIIHFMIYIIFKKLQFTIKGEIL